MMSLTSPSQNSGSMELLWTMPNSRINSWETWFIFNLRRKKQLVTHPAYYFFRFSMNHKHHDFLYTFIHTLATIPCSTLRMRPSWPRPWVRLSPSLAHTYFVPSLFVLAHPTACCLLQQLIFTRATLP